MRKERRMEEEGEREEGGEGRWRVDPHSSPSLHLFGEFADDTDQRSVLVLQTLVVRPQVHQDLAQQGGENKTGKNLIK